MITTFSGMPRWRPEDVNSAGEMIAARLEALGIPVTVHRPKLWLSVPLDASVTLAGERFRAKPPSSALSCPEGVTAKLVYLPAQKSSLRSYNKRASAFFGEAAGTDGEMRARLEGCILVTDGFGNPALTAIAEDWGAAGLIAINPGTDIHWGTCTTIWGSPDLDDISRKPRIPVAAVNHETGARLIAAAAEGAEATLRTEMQEGWFEQAIPVAEIRGAAEPEKFVLLHGHYDSWDVGVGDNATGDATMLECARLLWENRDSLHRSVRIAWWPGHSTGRYAGSTWFADAFAIDLDENCVMQVNCDSPGCRWATSYHQTTAMAETFPLVREVIETVAGQTPVFKRPNQAGDYSFNNIGLSSFFMLSSTMPDALREEKGYYAVSGCGGNIAWHTENDTLEIADRDVLKTDIGIYLLCIWTLATEPYLPVAWRGITAEFAATVARYAEAAGAELDLGPAAEAVAGLDAALEAFEAAVAGGRLAPVQANAVTTGLARILVPLNYTSAPRFAHDPAVTSHPLPAIEIVTRLDEFTGERRGFALTQALRGRNRTVAALRAATRLVEAATA
ncbi:M28 family peptidase [Oceanicella sp. SM1341]|uniref:M28 family peptidase n=1 Tax=Oceanicella sp. SM1341 TaxID=1548889 RepID=UPI001E5F674A|nr:M28 family peptidase [Oceanicella sp. SM1341]